MDHTHIDTANEPVQAQGDEFMDTGVLHETKRKPADDAEGTDDAEQTQEDSRE